MSLLVGARTRYSRMVEERGLVAEDVDAPERLPLGALFHARYELVGRLGEGGMGVVFDARDARDGAHVALKIMRASVVGDADLRARFEREALLPAEIGSAHLVRVLEAGVDAATGLPFLAMERLSGEDLAARLRRGPIPEGEALELLGQLGAALDAMHAAGIVHRDLKPENLYLAEGEGGPRLKVLDLGIAKILAASGASLHSTRTLGSPLYMSPEQLEGEATIDRRSDVYALGHVAFALLVGEAFWEGPHRRARGVYPVLIKVMRGTKEAASKRAVALGRSLPSAFDGWFARATALDPDDRFETAGEAVVALRLAMRGDARPGRPGRGRRRLRAGGIVAAIAAASLVGGALAASAKNDPQPTSRAPQAPGTAALEAPSKAQPQAARAPEPLASSGGSAPPRSPAAFASASASSFVAASATVVSRAAKASAATSSPPAPSPAPSSELPPTPADYDPTDVR